MPERRSRAGGATPHCRYPDVHWPFFWGRDNTCNVRRRRPTRRGVFLYVCVCVGALLCTRLGTDPNFFFLLCSMDEGRLEENRALEWRAQEVLPAFFFVSLRRSV